LRPWRCSRPNLCAAPVGQEKWEVTAGGFSCAKDLVKYIREQYGDYFCVSVAGYPEGHPDKIQIKEGGRAALTASELTRFSTGVAEDGSETVLVCNDADWDVELEYLRQKVDAGADFVLTQMFFDTGT
jgi:methylenetetrahydrofolate reductase (NADPH)